LVNIPIKHDFIASLLIVQNPHLLRANTTL